MYLFALCTGENESDPALFNENMLVFFLNDFLLESTLSPYLAVRGCPLLATVHRCAFAWMGGGGHTTGVNRVIS